MSEKLEFCHVALTGVVFLVVMSEHRNAI